MCSHHFKNSLFILIAIFFVSVLFYNWQNILLDQESLFLTTEMQAAGIKKSVSKKEKPAKRTVKAVYLTAYSAGNPNKVDSIIELINKTELNAVVIDIKDYSGKILYNIHNYWVNELKTEEDRIKNIEEVIKKFHKNNIYVIARQTVFQDPILAEKKSEWAIKNKQGELWRDNLKLAWVDPTSKSVWDYNIAIAKEAINLGFDEINFDYVRFPSDGNMADVVYTNGNKKKYAIMHDFYHFLNKELSNRPAWISIDLFGLTMETKGENDMSIGQRIVDAVDEVDYICPMMYPSHYPAGYLGLDNPADHPKEVIDNGMKKGIVYFNNKKAEVRPWLQAFNLKSVYDAEKIRAQIDAVEKYSSAGWLLWNAANKYTEAGLKLQ